DGHRKNTIDARQSADAASARDDTCPFGDESMGHGEADALAGARDDRDFADEIEIHDRQLIARRSPSVQRRTRSRLGRTRASERPPFATLRLVRFGLAGPVVGVPRRGGARNMTEHTVEGIGGLKVFVRSWQPEGKPRATVVINHGFKSHSGYYEWTA